MSTLAHPELLTPERVIRRVRAYFANPENVATGSYARTSQGYGTDVFDPNATCRCFNGAVAYVTGVPLTEFEGGDPDTEVRPWAKPIRRALPEAAHGLGLALDYMTSVSLHDVIAKRSHDDLTTWLAETQKLVAEA